MGKRAFSATLASLAGVTAAKQAVLYYALLRHYRSPARGLFTVVFSDQRDASRMHLPHEPESLRDQRSYLHERHICRAETAQGL